MQLNTRLDAAAVPTKRDRAASAPQLGLAMAADSGGRRLRRISLRIRTSSRRRPRLQRRRARARRIAPCPSLRPRLAAADLPIYLRGLGTVDAYNTVNVKPRVDGPIIAVHFKEGQIVTQGQVLVEIDPRTFQAVVEPGRGTTGARPGATARRRGESRAISEALGGAASSPSQQLDTQAAQVGQFQGVHRGRPGGHRRARNCKLGFTKVTAPISGRIGLRQVDIGNIVHARRSERRSR